MAPWRAGGWRLRAHQMRVAVGWGRLGEIVFDDPTRQLQAAAGVFMLLLGWNALSAPVLTPRGVNVAVYWWASRETLGWVRLLLGVGKMAVATRPRQAWRSKAGAAQAGMLLAGYTLTATWLASQEPALGVTSLWLLVINGWIAGRALYDRDINGTDRRDHPAKPSDVAPAADARD